MDIAATTRLGDDPDVRDRAAPFVELAEQRMPDRLPGGIEATSQSGSSSAVRYASISTHTSGGTSAA